MKRLLLSLLVWACSATAFAQTSEPCAPEITENRRAVIEHEGESGIWFNIEIARCMLGRVAAVPELQIQVDQLETRAQLSDERSALETRRGDVAVEESERASEALTAAVRATRRAEEEKDAWYRSPILWFTVGGIVVAAVVALTAYALSAVRDPI